MFVKSIIILVAAAAVAMFFSGTARHPPPPPPPQSTNSRPYNKTELIIRNLCHAHYLLHHQDPIDAPESIYGVLGLDHADPLFLDRTKTGERHAQDLIFEASSSAKNAIYHEYPIPGDNGLLGHRVAITHAHQAHLRLFDVSAAAIQDRSSRVVYGNVFLPVIIDGDEGEDKRKWFWPDRTAREKQTAERQRQREHRERVFDELQGLCGHNWR